LGVKTPRRSRLGYFAVAAAAILWAIGGTFARTLLDRGASAVELTAARAWITVLGVGAFVVLRRRNWPWEEVRRPRSIIMLIAFGLSLAAANFTYYAAIALLPVAVAIVIQYAAPAMVVAWKAVVARQRPSRRVIVALTLASAGVVLVSEVLRTVTTGRSPLSAAGIAVAFASAVAFCAYVLFGETVGARLGSERSVLTGFVIAGVFWAIVQIVRGRPDTLLNSSFWPGIIFLGIVTTIAPFMLFLWGLGVVSASPAGIISTLEPVSGALLAYVWLRQSLSPAQIAGAIAVIVGIALLQSDVKPVPEAKP
jgi:drug/metabolite transporter (DMT)-like permease